MEQKEEKGLRIRSLQSRVGCIVLRSINQAGILDTELLGHFRHFVVKTFHFLLAGCELLGKDHL